MDIRIELEGLDQYERGLARLITSITDLRPFWPKLVPLFIGWMREQFESEGGWGGDPWQELTPDYAAIKTQLYPGKGILYATGDLRDSASRPKRIATPTTFTLIIDDSQKRHGGRESRAVAGFHQYGTTKMPARPLIPDVLPAAAQLEVETAASEYVDEMQRRLGLL